MPQMNRASTNNENIEEFEIWYTQSRKWQSLELPTDMSETTAVQPTINSPE